MVIERYGTNAECGERGGEKQTKDKTRMHFLKTVDESQDMVSRKQGTGERGNVCMQHGQKGRHKKMLYK